MRSGYGKCGKHPMCETIIVQQNNKKNNIKVYTKVKNFKIKEKLNF